MDQSPNKQLTEEEREIIILLTRMETQITQLQADIADIRNSQKQTTDHFITRHEFEPVRMLVYGFTALILLAVVGALITTVIQ